VPSGTFSPPTFFPIHNFQPDPRSPTRPQNHLRSRFYPISRNLIKKTAPDFLAMKNTPPIFDPDFPAIKRTPFSDPQICDPFIMFFPDFPQTPILALGDRKTRKSTQFPPIFPDFSPILAPKRLNHSYLLGVVDKSPRW